MKSAYVPLPLLDMPKLKSLNMSTRKTHQKLKKCYDVEVDTGKVNYSQLPMRLTVSMIFTTKSVRDVGKIFFYP